MSRRDFARLVVSTIGSLLAYSVFAPAQVLALAELGHSALVNGAITSLFFVVVLAAGPFVHRLVARFGHRRLYLAAKGLLSAGYLVVVVDGSTTAWVLCTLVIGLGAAFLWPITEACVAELSPAARKGTYTGVYQAVLGAAFAAGPFVSSALAGHPRGLAVVCFAVSAVSGWWIRRFPWHNLARAEGLTHSDPATGPRLRRLVWVLVVCAFIGGFYENGFNGLTVLLGRAVGLGDEWALAVPGIIGVGSLLAQVPLGRLADAAGEVRVLWWTVALLTVVTASVPLAFAANGLIWPMAVCWGAAGGGLYTLSVVIISKQVEPRHVVHFTGLMVAAYTLGCAVAPTVGGAAFDASARWGLVAAFVPVMGVGLVAVSALTRRPAGDTPLQTPGKSAWNGPAAVGLAGEGRREAMARARRCLPSG